jgi:ATP-binding cassette, subfamily B, bacterial
MLGGPDRLLLRGIRLAGGWAVLLAVASVAAAAAELTLPAVLGRAVDAVLDLGGAGGAGSGGAPGGGDAAVPGGAAAWLAAVAVTVAVAATADALTELASGCGAARATARLRGTVLRHILALPPVTAARYRTGDLVGRLVAQAADAGSADSAAVLGLASLLPPVGSLVALLLIDPRLAAAFLAGLALLSALMRGFVTQTSAALGGYQAAQSTMAGHFVEALRGARTIAAAGTVDREIARVLGPLPALRGHGTRTWRTLATAAARGTLLAPLIQVTVVGAGGLLLSRGRLSPGSLLAAVQYAALGSGLGAVVATLNRLARTRAAAARLAEVLAREPARYGGSGVPAGPGTLRLRGVRVCVDGRPLLDGVDLTVPGGSSVAVVGRSGAGKSLLAAVAGRLRDPDEGEVLLDGVPLAELDRRALAGAVGYGFERPVLVGDTVGDAIGLGMARPEPARVARAARDAAIDAYVDRLPDGYRTGLRDAPMSGGEAQRLGLARALHGRRLLVLDDASSSVDSVTEAQLRRSLEASARGRTRLVVTHRTATAAGADLVAWLDGGRLRALAPHRLLWTDPEYRAVLAPGPAAAEAGP